ncbi:MAG: DUF429 domain-containing protein, partial [Mastigocladus sp. ERB_26_1]
LYNHITQTLPTLNPLLRLCGSLLPQIPTTGAELKAAEDKLDSLICAYVAAYWWYWGEQRNLVLGDCTTGYIVVPQRIGDRGEGEEFSPLSSFPRPSHYLLCP